MEAYRPFENEAAYEGMPDWYRLSKSYILQSPSACKIIDQGTVFVFVKHKEQAAAD